MIGYTLCYFIVVVPSFFSCSYTPGIIGDPSFQSWNIKTYTYYCILSWGWSLFVPRCFCTGYFYFVLYGYCTFNRSFVTV